MFEDTPQRGRETELPNHSLVMLSALVAPSPSEITILVACVAAIPPLLTVLFTFVRDRYAISARARCVDEATRLAMFARAYAEAITACSSKDISSDVRTQLETVLAAAALRVHESAALIHESPQPRGFLMF